MPQHAANQPAKLGWVGRLPGWKLIVSFLWMVVACGVVFFLWIHHGLTMNAQASEKPEAAIAFDNLLVSGVPAALVAPGSALTSWLQADGPHIVYASADQHLWQVWYTISSGQWAAQDLNTVPGSALIAPGSALTSWLQPDGPHFVYAATNLHIWQFWYTISSGQWAAQDLNTVPGSALIAPGSAMSSWLQPDGQSECPHFVYTAANQHLWQFWYTCSSGQWAAQDLNTVPGSALVGPNSPLTSPMSLDGPHVFYAAANQHPWQFWYTLSSGQWAAQDLNTVPGSALVAPGRAMTGWFQNAPDELHFAYATANQHLWQFWYTISSGQWAAQDLMTVPGAGLVAPGNALTHWFQQPREWHVVYGDPNQHLRQLWYTTGSGWAAQDLNTVPGSALVAPSSGLTSWVQSDGPHFVYADANQHLWQFWYTISSSQWAAQELTVSPRSAGGGNIAVITFLGFVAVWCTLRFWSRKRNPLPSVHT